MSLNDIYINLKEQLSQCLNAVSMGVQQTCSWR